MIRGGKRARVHCLAGPAAPSFRVAAAHLDNHWRALTHAQIDERGAKPRPSGRFTTLNGRVHVADEISLETKRKIFPVMLRFVVLC